MKYYVVSGAIEVDGTVYYAAQGKRPADEIDESEFRKADPRRHPDVYRQHPELGDVPELDEVESLLATGHIAPVA